MSVSAPPKVNELVSVRGDFTGLPENQPDSRDRPKFHDDQTPSCGLADMMSRYAALLTAPHPACRPGNNAGACHPRSMRLPELGLTLGCRADTRRCLDRDHGSDPRLDPDHRNPGLLLSRNQPDSRDQPRCPCHPSPNCSLRCRRIRYAD
jgi:hypothetical protein